MKRGEIHFVDLEPTRGREQQGRRPVLVVSPDKFNQVTGLPVILPITTGGAFAMRNGHTVELSGTNTVGLIRCDQPRVIDLEDRGARFVERLPASLLEEVLDRLITLFE